MWANESITETMLGAGDKDDELEDGIPRPRGMSYTNPQLALQVSNLSYDSPDIDAQILKGVLNAEKKLHNVSFSANSGKLTGIISSTLWEQDCLLDLLACRKKNGSFDGEIYLSGCPDNKKYIQLFAFVPHKTIYIPGLTFYDTMMYSAKLRLAGTDVDINKRVSDVMKIMQIWRSKNRVIPEHPEEKGDEGLKLRLLSIAIEIVSLPPLILISDPTLGLDASKAQSILESLQTLAKMGHIIVVTLPKPNPVLAEYYDNIVLLSSGYSIYSASLSKVEEYFTSKMLSYAIRRDEKGKAEVGPFEFVLDIASGVERPTNLRVPEHPIILQEKFEGSQFYAPVKPASEGEKTILYTSDVLDYFGYGTVNDKNLLVTLSRFVTVCSRAMYSKIKDKDPLQRSIASSVVLAVVIGYLQRNQGQQGYYLQTIFNFPYAFTSNLTSTLFFVTIFAFVVQVLNVHTLCQKVQVFRYEQASRCCSSIGFCLATIFSEVPFAFIYTWIFSTICYFWIDMAKGYYNYFYFCGTVTMVALVGLFTCLFFTALFKKEFAARNVYFLVIFFLLLLSGFPFQLGYIHGGPGSKIQQYMVEISKLNPLRWAFEALMQWKFTRGYIDPQIYLNTFSFTGYDHDHIFATLSNFIIFSGALFILLLLPLPSFLKRKPARLTRGKRTDSSASRDSDSVRGDSFDEASEKPGALAVSKRPSETIKPVIYSREGSLMGKSRLSTTVSQTGVDNDTYGPTVSFKEITYRVRDPRSPLGYKTVINNASGQFDRGNLSLIVGGNNSGKTSLLHALAGDVGSLSDFIGDVYYNKAPINKKKPLWQRCALVDAHDELYRDLTVEQAVIFAMKLRCWNFKGFSVIDENVKATLSLLKLEDIKNKKVKHCTFGERRRVSIAEEIVAGPKLVLIDEPTLELEKDEEANLMSTLRELVNQDRTVIASIQQPTANVFKLFDIVLLLSQGRVIYHGAADMAINFFVESPYGFNFTKYHNNPSDFLLAISSGTIKDKQGNMVLSDILDNYYRGTNLSINLMKRLEAKIGTKTGDARKETTTVNPMNKDANNVARTDTTTSIEVENKESNSFAAANPTGSCNRVTSLLQFLKIVFFTSDFSCSITEINMLFLKMGIILHRETINLVQRWELCVGALVIHIILASIFGWIVGDTGCDLCVYNATSFFAVGILILLLASIQFIYYIYRFQCVTLKEQSRGLYTNFAQWVVAGIPMYILRCICSMVFSAITYKMLKFDDENSKFGYFVASNMCAVLTMALLTEAILAYVPNQRAAYFMVPGTCFFQFTFSGLFIKAQSLPNWLAPWVTSISIIRWVFQGNWINQFNGDPRLPILPAIDFSAYDTFLHLFGWGGKTKETCLYNLFYFMVVCKILSYIAGSVATILHRCGRRYKEALSG